MFLRVSAGNWHNGSSIQVPLVKAGHLASPKSMGQGRWRGVPFARRGTDAMQRPMVKGSVV